MNIWQSYKQECGCLVQFAYLANTLLKNEESALLVCNFAKYLLIKKLSLTRLSSKPFLIWLLATPLHLKYVGTLRCDLSLMACFADINVSQGSVDICKVWWDF